MEIKVGKQYFRVSESAHSLDISADGENWVRCTGTLDSTAKYVDITPYQGYLLALCIHPFYGTIMKVFTELGIMLFDNYTYFANLVRFRGVKDGMLHAYDGHYKDFVLSEFDDKAKRFWWMRYDEWRKAEAEAREEAYKYNYNIDISTNNAKGCAMLLVFLLLGGLLVEIIVRGAMWLYSLIW